MENTVEFQEVEQGNWHILQAIGRIDAATAPQAESAALAAVDKYNQIALDMSKVNYISSAGLRVLLRAAKQAKKANKTFVLCGASGMVKEILEDSGMDMLFTIYESTGELK